MTSVAKPLGSDSSDRPRAFVHIGMHKTGSTSFQYWLDDHRDELRSRHGLLAHTGYLIPSHVELALLTVRERLTTPDRLLYPDASLPRVREALAAHVRATVESDVPDVVFSCEGLDFIREQAEVDALCDLLSPRTLTVVVAFREPDAYLASYQRTHLLFDGLRGEPLDTDSVMNVAEGSWLIDYEAIRSTWASNPRVDVVQEIVYEDAMARDGSVIPALIQALDRDPRTLPESAGYRANRTAELPMSRPQLEDALVEAGSELFELQSALGQARAELDHVYASRSWRLTRPLRAIVKRGSAVAATRPRIGRPRPRRPVVVCPFVHADERDRVAEAFATRRARDRLPLYLHHDTVLDGPEDAFQQCWDDVAPHDVILVHSDMRPMGDDHDGRWYRDLCQWSGDLPAAGAVACNLLFPPGDGRPVGLVQCAGGTLSGTAIDYIGSTRDVMYSPELAAVREVDWVTFGGVLLRRAALDECGPLDPGYEWGYVRDVDYSLEMRQRGWRLYHCPVALLHAESQTTGSMLEDPRYQAKVAHNFDYFRRKWGPFVGPDGVMRFGDVSRAGSI